MTPSGFEFLNIPPIPVRARVAYPSWDWTVTKWREEDYAAHFFVHAVKNDKVKIGTKAKYLRIGPKGEKVLVNRGNLEAARRYFAGWAAVATKEAGIADPVFIAIPNRNGTVDAQDFNSAFLAREAAIAFGEGAKAFTGLRFKELVAKEQGVRQSVADLIENMTLSEPVPDGTLVIIDDVFTLGRHITAAARVLGRDPKLIVVAGRTVKEPLEHMVRPQEDQHYCF